MAFAALIILAALWLVHPLLLLRAKLAAMATRRRTLARLDARPAHWRAVNLQLALR